MKNAADRLLNEIDKKKNPCIVGLDPTIDKIPKFLKSGRIDSDDPFNAIGELLFEFNSMIIDQIHDIVPAVKPQMAFYEMYGHLGVKAFEETIKYAKSKGLIVIEDGKRNDIGSTATAYAKGHIGRVSMMDGCHMPVFDMDYLTVNPYLGSDGLKPFITECQEEGNGIFILVKTSNPSSGELQDLLLEDKRPVFEVVASLVDELSNSVIGERNYSSVGAVVGATYPETAEKLRKLMPKSIFLVPGYGAQGGSAKDVCPCFNTDGYGAIVNSSRGIIFAYLKDKYNKEFTPEEFHKAARQAAIDMRDDIVSALNDVDKLPAHW